MNKQKNIKEYLHTLSRITLGEGARTRMRIALSEYAELHEVHAHQKAPSTPFLSFFSYFRTRTAAISAFAFVLVVATGTQATLASEKALPGDLLYPVKVSVREPLELALAADGKAKAQVATRLASKRVEEMSTLAAKGTLDQKTAKSLASRFDSHVAVIDTEAASIEATGKVSTALAVRTLAEADLTVRTEELPETEDEEFRAHVVEKTRTFGVERARLASALSVSVASTTNVNGGADAEEDTDLAVTLSALSKEQATTSTSTATTSSPKDSAGQRIFKAFFFKERAGTEDSTQFIKNTEVGW